MQITNAQPFDLSETDLTEYKHLDPRWHDWAGIQVVCDDLAAELFDRLDGGEPASWLGGFNREEGAGQLPALFRGAGLERGPTAA